MATGKHTRKTSERGLGWKHQQATKALLSKHIDGSPCWWCDRPMYRESALNHDGMTLQADHEVARKYGGDLPTRLLHGKCNASRGDGSRDDQRPALTGVDLDTVGVRPEWTLLDW